MNPNVLQYFEFSNKISKRLAQIEEVYRCLTFVLSSGNLLPRPRKRALENKQGGVGISLCRISFAVLLIIPLKTNDPKSIVTPINGLIPIVNYCN